MTPRRSAGDVLSVSLHWIGLDLLIGREITGVFVEDLDDDARDGFACVECGREPVAFDLSKSACLGDPWILARDDEMVAVAQGPDGPLFACRWGCPKPVEPEGSCDAH